MTRTQLAKHAMSLLVGVVGIGLAYDAMLPYPTHAGEINYIPGEPTAIQWDGDFLDGDEKKLDKVLAYRDRKGFKTEWLVLNSDGGLIVPALFMSAKVRERGIKTMVGVNQTCASACFIVWAGGWERWYWSSSSIGVHAIYNINTGEESTELNVAVVKSLKEYYFVPDAIIGKMVTTSPDTMAWLKGVEFGDWAIWAGDK